MASSKYILVVIVAAVVCVHQFFTGVQSSLSREDSQCPPAGSNFVTVQPGGRLGNVIFEYLSVWAFAGQTGAFPVVPSDILQRLSFIFNKQGMLPALEEVAENCGFDFLMKTDFKGVARRYKTQPGVTVLRDFAFDWQSLIPNWKFLKNLLSFNSYLADRSQRILANISQIGNYTQFVAVHVRRGDYLSYMHNKFNESENFANATFFLRAMDEMRRSLPSPPAFIVTSDDLAWCHFNLKVAPDVFMNELLGVDLASPAEDLALLAACNHTILSYGTFGMAVAMFNSDGRTIVFDTSVDNYDITTPIAKALSNWTMLGN